MSFIDAEAQPKCLAARSFEAEAREREALELKLNRAGLSGGPIAGGTDTPAVAGEKKALATFFRTGDNTELKTFSVGSDADGGLFSTPWMSTTMTSRLREESPLYRLARIESMPTGSEFEEINEREDIGDATWTGEHTASADRRRHGWRVPRLHRGGGVLRSLVRPMWGRTHERCSRSHRRRSGEGAGRVS